jgi:hypothetical protein
VALDQLKTRDNVGKTTAIGSNNSIAQQNINVRCRKTERSHGKVRNAATEFCSDKTVLPHCPHFCIKEK